MFRQSWSLWLAVFASNLCTSVKLCGGVLHRGLGVYGKAWRAHANVCACDYKYAGWAQGDCFPSVPVCSYDAEWHLFLRSVPTLSRGATLTQVSKEEGHFSSPAILACLQRFVVGFSCCRSFREHPVAIVGRPMSSNEMTKHLFTRDLKRLPSNFQSRNLGVSQEQVHRLKLCSWESHNDPCHLISCQPGKYSTWLYYMVLPAAEKGLLFTFMPGYI